MSNIQRTGWIAGCAIAMALGGCRSAPTRIYTLQPAAPAVHIDAYHAPALRIDTLNVPAAWDRIEILRLSSTGELRISDFDHWAAPLSQMARQVLSDDLDRRLPAGSVIYPRLPKPSDALGVNIDILNFSIAASQASIRASWIIVPSRNAQTAKRSAATLSSAMSSQEPAAIARAWSDLMGQLADRIAVEASALNLP